MVDRNQEARKKALFKRLKRLNEARDQDIEMVKFELEKQYDEYQKQERKGSEIEHE